jgi:hypothetical protein
VGATHRQTHVCIYIYNQTETDTKKGTYLQKEVSAHVGQRLGAERPPEARPQQGHLRLYFLGGWE